MTEMLDNPLGFESEAFIPEDAHEAFGRAEITASILLSVEDDNDKTRSCTLMLSVEPPTDIPYKTLNPPPSSALCALEEIAGAIQSLVADQKALFGRAWLQAWTEEQEKKRKSRKSRKKKTSKSPPKSKLVEKPTEERVQEEKAELVEEERKDQPETAEDETEDIKAQANKTDEVDEDDEHEQTEIDDEEAEEDADDVDDEDYSSDQLSLLGGIEL